MNVTTDNTFHEKDNMSTIIQKIGGIIFFLGLMIYFIAEIVQVSYYVENFEVYTALIMTYFTDAMGIICTIMFIRWLLIKEDKRQFALKQTLACVFFYLFVFSFSQIWYPLFYEFEQTFPGEFLSIYFAGNYLNFIGLIVMIVLSLAAFIYMIPNIGGKSFSTNQKILGTIALVIINIISQTMMILSRGILVTPEFMFFPNFTAQLFFLPRFMELIISILLLLMVIPQIFFDNKQINTLLRSTILIITSILYLATTLTSGFIFDMIDSYTTLSVGKIVICVGASIVTIGSVIIIGKNSNALKAIATREVVLTAKSETDIIPTQEVKPVKATKKSKKKTKEPIEPEVEQEEVFEETEGYDELFETGLYHIRNGEYDRAVEYWERCVKVKPDFLPGWNNLGLAYKDMEQLDKAIACWSKAIEIDPNYTEATHNLEVALLLKRKKRK